MADVKHFRISLVADGRSLGEQEAADYELAEAVSSLVASNAGAVTAAAESTVRIVRFRP